MPPCPAFDESVAGLTWAELLSPTAMLWFPAGKTTPSGFAPSTSRGSSAFPIHNCGHSKPRAHTAPAHPASSPAENVLQRHSPAASRGWAHLPRATHARAELHTTSDSPAPPGRVHLCRCLPSTPSGHPSASALQAAVRAWCPLASTAAPELTLH